MVRKHIPLSLFSLALSLLPANLRLRMCCNKSMQMMWDLFRNGNK